MLNLNEKQASVPWLVGERTTVFSPSMAGRPPAYRNFPSPFLG
jgi:hypothetical protein